MSAGAPRLLSPGQPLETGIGDAAARGFWAHITTTAPPVAPNVRTAVWGLVTGATLVPITVNETESDNAWVASLWAALAGFALEAAARRRDGIGCLLAIGAGVVGAQLRRAEIDRVAQINNWLLSTNPAPEGPVTADAARALVACLVAAFPDHVLSMRALTRRHDGPVLNTLAAAGFRVLPIRDLWIYPASPQDWARKRDVKNDLRLLERGSFPLIPGRSFDTADFQRAARIASFRLSGQILALSPCLYGGFLAHVSGTAAY